MHARAAFDFTIDDLVDIAVRGAVRRHRPVWWRTASALLLYALLGGWIGSAIARALSQPWLVGKIGGALLGPVAGWLTTRWLHGRRLAQLRRDLAEMCGEGRIAAKWS